MRYTPLIANSLKGDGIIGFCLAALPHNLE